MSLTLPVITVYRDAADRDRLRKYGVYIDGVLLAQVAEEESREIEVAPGKHTIWVKVDWARSPKVPVELAAGDTKWFRCRSSGSALMAPFDGVFRPGRYLSLQESLQPSQQDASKPASSLSRTQLRHSLGLALIMPIVVTGVLLPPLLVFSVATWIDTVVVCGIVFGLSMWAAVRGTKPHASVVSGKFEQRR
jgi:hypothetical protein